ncbi:MAG TPA: thiamine pyrophosphate-binding protein, partial [Casimicrobiaceae bacterium]|nr:thiamine pyrophosphate-binding protein [Casimicrobiaceae bacterium]
RSQGAHGLGPVRTAGALAAAVNEAATAVRAGAVTVIDARVAPEYSRAASGSLLRHLPKR